MPHASLTTYPELADRLILLDGWSKTYAMTGWRLGWGVWPKSLVEHATRLAINIIPASTPRPSGPASRRWPGRRMPSPTWSTTFDAAAQDHRRRAERTPGLPLRDPGGAFYAFPNIEGTGKSSRQLQEELLNEVGVATISGTSFGRHGEGFVRFSYAASSEAIEEACQRIRGYLER